ncbi:MAG: hypothetical protein ACLVHV_03700 [Oscillospiraceae bacterium]
MSTAALLRRSGCRRGLGSALAAAAGFGGAAALDGSFTGLGSGFGAAAKTCSRELIWLFLL